MKKPFLYWIFAFFFLGAATLFSLDSDFDADGYADFSDYINGLYGIDPNAGGSAFPVLNAPMGGRAEGMAGAFAAVADDVSFIEWNPAGSASLKLTQLAFFHNNWIADAKIEGAVFSSRLGNLGYGIAGKWLWTPFTEYGDFGERLSKGYYSEAAAFINVSYNFFHGYYFDGVSFGVNIKAALRSAPDYTEDGALASGSGKSQSATAFLADAGLLTRINLLKFYSSAEKNASFALVIRNYGEDVMGDPLPTALSAGVSYKPFRPFTFSADVTFPLYITNLTGLDASLSEKPYVSFGFSSRITSFLSAHLGVMVKAGGGRFTAGSEILAGNIVFCVNYTLDLLTQAQPLNRVTAGVRFDLGDGGRQAKRETIEKMYMEGMLAYSEGRNEEARDIWEEALTIDKTFEPITEALNVLKNFENLEKRIVDVEEASKE
ncbi:MAG: UPF0164 family protein [Spirochaetaceae bacterium]|nr:UPF0164 family protein [Spirochaetaceae bacterium]